MAIRVPAQNALQTAFVKQRQKGTLQDSPSAACLKICGYSGVGTHGLEHNWRARPTARTRRTLNQAAKLRQS